MPPFSRPKVLILDDNPTHLDVYAWLLQAGGFDPVPVLVPYENAGPLKLPAEIQLVLMDYHLKSLRTSVELAAELKATHPDVPLVVMSEAEIAPADIRPFLTDYIRKGSPERLVGTLRALLPVPAGDASLMIAPAPHSDQPKGACALVVEDDSRDAWLFRRALELSQQAVRVCTVKDGDDALSYLQGTGQYADREAHPVPSLILLDIKLPRRNGFEVLSWLREREGALGQLPVVMLSSSSLQKDIFRAYELGANGYVVKPFGMENIRRTFHYVLGFWCGENRTTFHVEAEMR